MKKKSRVLCKGIYYELIFILLTYGYACSDWATSIIERQLQNDEIDLRLRQVFYIKLIQSNYFISSLPNFITLYKQAADLLRKAGGVFAYIGEQICPKWNNDSISKPVDVLMEIPTSISK